VAVPIQQIEGDFTINTHGSHIAAQFTHTPGSTATFGGLAAYGTSFAGGTMHVFNADSTNITIYPSNSITYTSYNHMGAHNYQSGAQNVDSDAKATQSLHVVFTAAIADGYLKMALTPTTYGGETSITLTQNVGGATGNTAITIPDHLTTQGGADGVDGTFAQPSGDRGRASRSTLPTLTVVPFSVGASAKVVPCLGFRNKPYILSKGGDPSAMG